MAQITLNSSGVASSGSLLLQTNGTTTQATVDTSGNLGLGVTPVSSYAGYKTFQIASQGVISSDATSNGELEINNNAYRAPSTATLTYINTAAATKYAQYRGEHRWFNAASGTAGNTISFTQAMTLDASGNLGVGTSSPSGALGLYRGASTSCMIEIAGNANTPGSTSMLVGQDSTSSGYCWNRANSVLLFGTNNTERARIDSSGNLLVGTTQSGIGTYTGFRIVGTTSAADRAELGSAASTNSGIGWSMYSTGAGAYRFYVGYGGTIYATSTTITGISDVRLKENIRDLDDGLEKIMALQPRKFDWKEGKGQNIKNARGFIAQEFETVFPDMIEEWLDDSPEGEEPYKAVNANLVPTLVKAIQELNAKFEAYKAAHP